MCTDENDTDGLIVAAAAVVVAASCVDDGIVVVVVVVVVVVADDIAASSCWGCDCADVEFACVVVAVENEDDEEEDGGRGSRFGLGCILGAMTEVSMDSKLIDERRRYVLPPDDGGEVESEVDSIRGNGWSAVLEYEGGAKRWNGDGILGGDCGMTSGEAAVRSSAKRG